MLAKKITPTLRTPAEPDVQPIIDLHRGHDGYIAFTRKDAAGRFETIASVPASELERVFPQYLAPLVDEESFYSINGFHLRNNVGPSKLVPELPAASWSTRALRWLTAAYVDFDHYRVGMTTGEAMGVLIDAQERDLIPPPSLITNSGRGLWAFWLLRNADERTGTLDGPARAWAESIACYQRIERALTRLVESIEPDRGARDAARITRIPGSLNRMAQARVGYWWQLKPNGDRFVYTLDELAALLNVAPCKLEKGMRAALNPVASEKAATGYRALWRSRLDRMVQLIAIRGRVQLGCRNRAALLLSVFMHKCKIDAREIETTVGQFGRAQCTPALTTDEINSAIREGPRYTKLSDALIGDWLRITAHESDRIFWPAAGSGSGANDAATRNRTDAARSRRELVRHFWEASRTAGQQPPTLEQMRDSLGRYGVACAIQTISNDLGKLGIVNPRGKRAASTQPTLHGVL